MMKKILFILSAIWWVGTLWYIHRSVAAQDKVPVPDVDIVKVGGKIEKQDWYSVYWRGEKIGYSMKSVQRTARGYLINDLSYMRLPVGGTVQEIYAKSLLTTDSTFAITNFSFDLQSGDYNATADGRIDDNKIYVVLRTPMSEDTAEFEIDGKIYPPSMLPELFAAAKRERKEFRGLMTFDPFTVSRTLYEVVSQRRTKKSFGGKERDIWVVEVEAQGLRSKMWISDDGTLWMERTENGFMQAKEPQEEALKFDLSRSGKQDILKGFAIMSFWKPKVQPRQAKYAKFHLEGFKTELLELEDFNQRLSGDTLEVCAEGFEPDAKPTPADTAEEPFIQCHDLRIVKKAREIAGTETDTLKILERINSFLYENIEKDYQSAIPSAVDVLKKMRGDCNEHSTLFVALARALGIPARINVGVVYREDGYFYYHAWVQAHTGGRWHTFDPTFGQAPADASHIKFLSGSLDKQVQILRLADISIKVLEADTLCPRR